MNKELAEHICEIVAVEIKRGYRIEAVFHSGGREVIKGQSTRKPSMVQLHDCPVNGNFRGDGIGQYFTFSKSVIYQRDWIKSFEVR